jgi:hypothetical protein
LLLTVAMIRMPREKGFPFLLILLARLQHVIRDHQQAVPYGQGCPFPSSPLVEPTRAFSQRGARTTHAMGCLDQG